MSDISSSIHYYVRELRDFPDGNIIQHVTQLAIQHISSANQVVDVIIAVLIDQRTPPSFKKPLFYLIDSILKRAGGPYNHLFQQRFISVFPVMIGNVSEEDRKKLDFLLGTWGERNFFAIDFLRNLKIQLATVRVRICYSKYISNEMTRESIKFLLLHFYNYCKYLTSSNLPPLSRSFAAKLLI